MFWQSVRKWGLRGALALAVIVVVTLVTLPFWMGAALRLALPEESVTFGSCERLSYGRFLIDDLNIETPQASIRIDRIKSYTPVYWLWRAYQEKDSDPFANVGEVQLELKNPEAGANDAASPVPANLFEVLELARSPLELLSVWVPHVAVESVKGSFAAFLETLKLG